MHNCHNALAQPLLGNPGFSKMGKTETILINEMPCIEDVLSDDCMSEATRIPEKLASTRREQQKPNRYEYACLVYQKMFFHYLNRLPITILQAPWPKDAAASMTLM